MKKPNFNTPPKVKVLNIPKEDVSPVLCPNCKGQNFAPGHRYFSISAYHPKNPTGITQYHREPIDMCMQCGEVQIKGQGWLT